MHSMLVSPAVVAVVMSLGSPYFSGTDVGDSFGVSNEVGKKIINAASTHRGVMTGKLWKIFIHTALGNDVPEECPKFPKAPSCACLGGRHGEVQGRPAGCDSSQKGVARHVQAFRSR